MYFPDFGHQTYSRMMKTSDLSICQLKYFWLFVKVLVLQLLHYILAQSIASLSFLIESGVRSRGVDELLGIFRLDTDGDLLVGFGWKLDSRDFEPSLLDT